MILTKLFQAGKIGLYFNSKNHSVVELEKVLDLMLLGDWQKRHPFFWVTNGGKVMSEEAPAHIPTYPLDLFLIELREANWEPKYGEKCWDEYESPGIYISPLPGDSSKHILASVYKPDAVRVVLEVKQPFKTLTVSEVAQKFGVDKIKIIDL